MVDPLSFLREGSHSLCNTGLLTVSSSWGLESNGTEMYNKENRIRYYG